MVSIVILNYNSLGLLEPLLKSLVEYLPSVGWECLIRDNSTSPNDKNECLNLLKSDVRFRWFSKPNEGNFSSMNNEMITHCFGDYILFLNNDMIARCDFLTPMLKLMEVKNMGVVGACLVYPDHSKTTANVQHAGIIFDNDQVPSNVCHKHIRNKQINGAHFCFHDRYFQAVTGACLLISKADFLAVDGFCEDYDWCFDDVDLCLRVRYGLKKDCAVAMKAGLTHYENWTVAKNKSPIAPDVTKVSNAFATLLSRWSPFIVRDLPLYQADYARVYP